ncbi:MAG: hypothetical protein ABIN80_00560 [Dyadobacter sp.]|uniref:DUF6932 family protein n=1 Tax=Dyadobacter sp. TaxID=1914288 RepID=UPI0032667638
MSNLEFDKQGYLIPYDLIDIEWFELEEVFVFSHVRATVFIEFKKLVQELSSIGIKNFEIWIDGSFASKPK